MPRTWPTKWHQVMHWRLQAMAADGLVVTLGRYKTVEEAHTDHRHFAKQGVYSNITLHSIEPKPDPSSAEFIPR